MPPFVADDSGVEIARRDNAVVVPIPSGSELGEQEAQSVNDEYLRACGKTA